MQRFSQDSGKQDMGIIFLPKFIEICMEMPCGALPDGHQHGGWKPTETSVIEFCYKMLQNSRAQNHKNYTLSNSCTVQMAKFSK